MEHLMKFNIIKLYVYFTRRIHIDLYVDLTRRVLNMIFCATITINLCEFGYRFFSVLCQYIPVSSDFFLLIPSLLSCPSML